MAHTPQSLLDRVSGGNDSPAWPQFLSLYRPLLRRWLTQYFLQEADADDVVQDVLVVVVAKMPEFRHGGGAGAFRAWLRQILTHRLQTHWRKSLRRPAAGPLFDLTLAELADDSSSLTKAWDEEHDRHLISVLLDAVKPEFQPTTWQAFWQTSILETPVADVARSLGLSPNAVFIARSRVLQRLREEAAGLLDD
jgi:RNA polymerase sigma-70 factor, ECF subfamily